MSDDEKTEMREFVSEMRELRGELREYRKNQDARCANHSRRLDDLASAHVEIQQAIGYRRDDRNTIHMRVQVLETFRGYFKFIFESVAWVAGAGGVLYAVFSLLVHTVKTKP